MAIALNELGELNIYEQGAALAMVAIAVTLGVYGAVALIVKLDDIGLHLAAARQSRRAKGRRLPRPHGPGPAQVLASLGTAAMLWVGGGILLHGMEELGAATIPAHRPRPRAQGRRPVRRALGPIVEWIANAIGAAIAGAIVGGIIVLIVHQFTKKPEKLVVDG